MFYFLVKKPVQLPIKSREDGWTMYLNPNGRKKLADPDLLKKLKNSLFEITK